MRPAHSVILDAARSVCSVLPPGERSAILEGVASILDTGVGAARQSAAMDRGGRRELLVTLRGAAVS